MTISTKQTAQFITARPLPDNGNARSEKATYGQREPVSQKGQQKKAKVPKRTHFKQDVGARQPVA